MPSPAIDCELSYLCGKSETPLLYLTVDRVLRDAAERWPTRTALVVRHQGLELNGSA